jgi:hypothetical protein
VDDPLWVEIAKSRFAAKQVERVLNEGAELLFVWGGDGTAQRSIDALAGSETALAIVPPGLRTSWQRTSGSRSTSSRLSRSGFGESVANSTSAGSTASASR